MTRWEKSSAFFTGFVIVFCLGAGVWAAISRQWALSLVAILGATANLLVFLWRTRGNDDDGGGPVVSFDPLPPGGTLDVEWRLLIEGRAVGGGGLSISARRPAGYVPVVSVSRWKAPADFVQAPVARPRPKEV